MQRFKNILFIADRDDGLQAALERAFSVAETNRARLTVMDITPDTGLADSIRQSYDVDLNAQLREHRLQALDSLCSRIPTRGHHRHQGCYRYALYRGRACLALARRIDIAQWAGTYCANQA